MAEFCLVHGPRWIWVVMSAFFITCVPLKLMIFSDFYFFVTFSKIHFTLATHQWSLDCTKKKEKKKELSLESVAIIERIQYEIID